MANIFNAVLFLRVRVEPTLVELRTKDRHLASTRET